MQNSKLTRRLLLRLVCLYQQTLSPDHGLIRGLFPSGVCRYEETCSQYTYRAIEQHGVKGVIMGLNRVLHCHPFAKV